MKKQEYIYQVSFKEPTYPEHPASFDDEFAGTDFFFTSIAAIYDTFSAKQIGCKVERLWNLKISPDKPYVGRKCTITKEPLGRKKHKQKQ